MSARSQDHRECLYQSEPKRGCRLIFVENLSNCHNDDYSPFDGHSLDRLTMGFKVLPQLKIRVRRGISAGFAFSDCRANFILPGRV